MTQLLGKRRHIGADVFQHRAVGQYIHVGDHGGVQCVLFRIEQQRAGTRYLRLRLVNGIGCTKSVEEILVDLNTYAPRRSRQSRAGIVAQSNELLGQSQVAERIRLWQEAGLCSRKVLGGGERARSLCVQRRISLKGMLQRIPQRFGSGWAGRQQSDNPGQEHTQTQLLQSLADARWACASQPDDDHRAVTPRTEHKPAREQRKVSVTYPECG